MDKAKVIAVQMLITVASVVIALKVNEYLNKTKLMAPKAQ